MASVRDIISRAFRKIAVSSSDAALTAEEIDVGVDMLNMMLHEWKLSGVDTSHVDVAASDDFPLSQEYEFGTVYMLAMRLAPDFVVPVAFDADDFFRRVQAAYMSISTVAMPAALTDLPSTQNEG